MMHEELSSEEKVIYKDIDLLPMENCKCIISFPYWFQHAMKKDFVILITPICMSLNTCVLHGLFED